MLKAKAAKVLALMVLTFAAATSAQAFEKPVLIAEQGSFGRRRHGNKICRKF